MVLVISPARATASKSQLTDQYKSTSGPPTPSDPSLRNAWTIEAITPAAAGVGIPTKYFDPPGAIPLTLNRAKRQAQAIKNARQQSQPRRPTQGTWLATLRTPHAYAKIAGATPKLTTSASESNCTPNSVLVPVMRAMRPSSESKTMAMPMAFAAWL